MPTPFPPRRTARSSWTDADARPNTSNPEWRCTRCGKLLGVLRDGRLQVRFSGGHEYS